MKSFLTLFFFSLPLLLLASALRVMSSIRVKIIVQLIMLAIQKCVKDVSPYVRKTAAHAISKVYRYLLLLSLLQLPTPHAHAHKLPRSSQSQHLTARHTAYTRTHTNSLHFSLDPDHSEELIEVLKQLLADRSTMVTTQNEKKKTHRVNIAHFFCFLVF